MPKFKPRRTKPHIYKNRFGQWAVVWTHYALITQCAKAVRFVARLNKKEHKND